MKKTIITLVILSTLLIPLSTFGLEYIWTDEQGNRIYDCGGHAVAGKVRVKDRGYGIYRVHGVLINREIHADSIIHAARIACGEAKEEPAEMAPPPGKSEGK